MPINAEEFEQLLRNYAQWKIDEAQKRTPEVQQRIEDIKKSYDANQPFVIMAPTPNLDWEINQDMNPFLLEKSFRLKNQLAPTSFFVINNHNNFHWDCYQKSPGYNPQHFPSSAHGNSCASYTLLNIINQIPPALRFIDEVTIRDAMLESKIENLNDVNKLSSKQVRNFLKYIFKNKVREIFLGEDEIFNQLLEDIKNDGTFLLSDHLRYGLLAIGVNFIEASDLGYQHGDILNNIKNNLFGFADENPEKNRQEEFGDLIEYLGGNGLGDKIEDILNYIKEFSEPLPSKKIEDPIPRPPLDTKLIASTMPRPPRRVAKKVAFDISDESEENPRTEIPEPFKEKESEIKVKNPLEKPSTTKTEAKTEETKKTESPEKKDIKLSKPKEEEDKPSTIVHKKPSLEKSNEEFSKKHNLPK